jgi:hypothetical protein
LLASGADFNLQNNKGNTPLYHAAWGDNLTVVQTLLDLGADINQQNDAGDTASSFSRKSQFVVDDDTDEHSDEDSTFESRSFFGLDGLLDLLQMLLDRGADIDHQNKIGDTPVLRAAWVGHYEVVKLLLDRGADVHHQNNNGDTLLLATASRGHLAKEAEVNLPNHAAWNRDDDYSYELQPSLDLNDHLDLLQMLLDQRVDVNLQNNKGNTPLLRAAWAGSHEVVKLLLDRGADVHHENNKGDSPLLLAASRGHLDVVRVLLDGGAIINLQNTN